MSEVRHPPKCGGRRHIRPRRRRAIRGVRYGRSLYLLAISAPRLFRVVSGQSGGGSPLLAFFYGKEFAGGRAFRAAQPRGWKASVSERLFLLTAGFSSLDFFWKKNIPKKAIRFFWDITKKRDCYIFVLLHFRSDMFDRAWLFSYIRPIISLGFRGCLCVLGVLYSTSGRVCRVIALLLLLGLRCIFYCFAGFL